MAPRTLFDVSVLRYGWGREVAAGERLPGGQRSVVAEFQNKHGDDRASPSRPSARRAQVGAVTADAKQLRINDPGYSHPKRWKPSQNSGHDFFKRRQTKISG
jgi:hypothetical protein